MTRALALGIVLLALSAGPSSSQDQNRTQLLAKELTDLLQQQKTESMATRLGEDHFAAVLYFPGVQLLVVSARYTAPALLNEKIISRQYREVYLDLASASVPDSKLLIEDSNGNGLRPDRDGNAPFDIVTKGTGASFTLDGDHKKKKISREEYLKTYDDYVGSYEKILAALIAQAKK